MKTVMAHKQKIAAVNKITSATTTSRGSAITLLLYISTTIDGRERMTALYTKRHALQSEGNLEN